MKAICLFVLLLGPMFGAIDLTKPIPRLRLPDGRILQDAVFTQYRPLDVAVRHKAGVLALRYESLPDEIRAEAEQKRPGGPKWFPGETADPGIALEGQVFVQTRGAGPYKFGNVKVYAFDARHITLWSESYGTEVRLPKPLSEATTDADGRFKMKVPKDTPYFIYCAASRLVGNTYEFNEWRVPGGEFKNAKEIILGNGNVAAPTKTVIIEETP